MSLGCNRFDFAKNSVALTISYSLLLFTTNRAVRHLARVLSDGAEGRKHILFESLGNDALPTQDQVVPRLSKIVSDTNREPEIIF